jgi:uracil phosphoribosyltransferase
MAVVLISDKVADDCISKYNEICKSDSGICGKELRAAHTELGKYTGHIIAEDYPKAQRIALIVMMRAGLPYSFGIADELETNCKSVSMIFVNHNNLLPNDFRPSDYSLIVICDAVIRTGKGVLSILEQIGGDIVFATNVLDNQALQNFSRHKVYTSRISENSYVGAKQHKMLGGKGPDTGDRLFDSGFIDNLKGVL